MASRPSRLRSRFLEPIGEAGTLQAAIYRALGSARVYWWNAGSTAAARRLGDRLRLSTWRMGLIVRRGNSSGIAWPDDLRGSRLLAEAGAAAKEIRGRGAVYGSHLEATEAVGLGAADVGVGLEAAAAALHLDFLPWTTEICELWIPEDALDLPEVGSLLACVESDAFRADLSAFGPYDTSETGAVEDGPG